jgi:amidase
MHSDYTQFLDAGGLKGAHIGVVRDHWGHRADVDALSDKNLAVLRDAGAEVIDIEDLTGKSQRGDQMAVLLYEFKAGLNRYLAGLGAGARVKTLADVIAFNEANAAREMPFFDQSIFLEAEKKGPLTDAAYLEALARLKKWTQADGIDRAASKYKVDALVAPSTGPAWVTDLINGDSGGDDAAGVPAIAGYPHITVPGGFVHGLPVGFSFFGPAWSEPVLLKLAYAFEQATTWRKPPPFRAGVDPAGAA